MYSLKINSCYISPSLKTILFMNVQSWSHLKTPLENLIVKFVWIFINNVTKKTVSKFWPRQKKNADKNLLNKKTPTLEIFNVLIIKLIRF